MIGQTIGHYKILDKLGAGGMGEVYLAEDTDLGRNVALKVLPKAMAGSQERLERFRREAKTLASFNHPNIVTIHSVEQSDGVHFLTMEFIEGQTLADYIPKRGVSLEQFFRTAIPIADALSTAHEAGVIHRDLKPANVFVTQKGEVKVLDFGLAKLMPAADVSIATDASTEPLTGEGRVLGTVPYMSPEQLQGESIDERSDIFSLGIILYQLATGNRPFEGSTSAEVASSILRDLPRPVDDLKHDMPRHLGRIVRLCLEKQPDQRLQSAKDLRNELSALRQELTTEETQARPTYRPERRWQARAGWVAAAVVGLVAVVMIAISQWAPEKRVTSPPVGREAQVLLDQGHQFELRGVTEDNLFEAEDRYRRALQLEPANPLIEARLAALLARTQMQYPEDGRISEIHQLLERALARDSDLSEAWIARGRLALLEEDGPAAEQSARRALKASPRDYCGYTLLGESLLAQDRIDEGLLELRRAVALAGADMRARLTLAYHLSWDLGRVNEAAAEYEKVLDYAPDSPSALNNLGIIYGQQGRFLDAVPLFRRLVLLENDVDAAINLAVCYFYLDRLPATIEAYEKALEIQPDHPKAQHGLAEAYEKLGEQQQAEQWFEKALASYDRLMAAGAPRSRYLGMRAVCAAKLGHHDEALANIAEAEELQPGLGPVLFGAAQVHAIAGRRQEVLRYAQLAIQSGYARQEFERDLAFRDYLEDPEFQSVLESAVTP